jgi:hypothetical protein
MTEVQVKTKEQRLQEWYLLQEELKKLKFRESILRRNLFDEFFTDPKEGTNSFDLEGGYVLKGDYIIERKVDEAAFTKTKEELVVAKINPDKVVRWKPELAKAEYNKLTAEQKLIVDNFLIVKPGSPQMKVEEGKELKKQKAGIIKAEATSGQELVIDPNQSEAEPEVE